MNSRQLLRALGCGALLLATAPAARAEGTFDIPPGAHFNPEKLAKVSEFFKNEVATGKIAGANVLIRQHGKPVYHEVFGVQDVVSKTPITDETIFRLFSMTKAITSVVAMQLIEEGKIKLDDPVAKYIPSFANVKVGVEKKADDGTKTLELCRRTGRMTILDLMRQTSGITYGFYGDSLVRQAYEAANIYAGDFDNAEFAERIAKLPLQNQPGALWQYGHSTDILARDHGDRVRKIPARDREGKAARSARHDRHRLLCHRSGEEEADRQADAERQRFPGRAASNDPDVRQEVGIRRRRHGLDHGGSMRASRRCCSTAASSTARPYLKPETFKLMTTDQVGRARASTATISISRATASASGSGLAVRTDPGNAKPPPPGSLGELKWDGASGCYFVIDRKQDMFFVLLEQTPTERQRIQRTLKQLIYEAMEN